MPVTRAMVLGVLSLILWALIIVVTIKYVLILLRADNNGEGGTLSLTALAFARARTAHDAGVDARRRSAPRCSIGDSLITPAISVLSAVEGLKLARRPSSTTSCRSPSSSWSACSPCNAAAPRRVAALFGPIMLVWFSRSRGRGAAAYQRRSRRVHGHQSAATRSISSADTRHDRAGDARRGLSGRDRRRSAVRRSRAFRPQADPDRMALRGLAGAADQLFRAGRPGARQSGGASTTRSTAWCRNWCCCRWWCWRRRRP